MLRCILMEVFKNEKNDLIFNFTCNRIFLQSNPPKNELNFKEIIPDFINQKHYLVEFEKIFKRFNTNNLSHREREEIAMECKRIISKSKFKNSTQQFLCLFLDAYYRGIITLNISFLLNFINDMTQLLSMEKIKNNEIINYIEFKYNIHENLITNEPYFHDFYNPLLFAYSEIDYELYYKLLYLKNKDNNTIDLLVLLRSFINNQLHFNIFVKLLLNLKRNSDKSTLANILNTEELIEYIRLKLEYEEKFNKYKVSSLEDAFILSFIKILSNGATIKKCNGCNNFFIAENKNAKACSPECKNTVINANKTKRNENALCYKSTQAIKKFGSRLETYDKRKTHDNNISQALWNILEYYREVSNQVRKALRENTDNINDDKEFLNNFDNWCDKIVPTITQINNLKNIDDVMYYKLSRNCHEYREYKYLWM